MKEKEPSFGKGLLFSFAIYSTSVPVAFIPVIGVFLSVTMVPYLSSALGARFAHPRERIPLAITTALVWSSLETAVVITVMRAIANMTPMGFRMDGIGTAIIVLLWLSNLVFGVLGAIHPWKDPFTDKGEVPDEDHGK